MIVIITTINCAAVSVGGQIATFFTVIKIALVLFVGLGAFFLADGSFGNFGTVNDGGVCEGVENTVKYGAAGFTFIGGFGAAMLGALWGYDGWNNLTLVAGEVKNPQRNIPLALIGGTILIILLYVFIHFAYFYVLTPTEVASVSTGSSVAREVAFRFFGAGILSLMAAGLMASSVGTLHTSILTGARVPYAMAKDGIMFQTLGKLSATRVPVGALIVQGIWACLLAISGSFDTLTDYVVFGSWIFYTVVTASIFVFRKKYPDAIRPYKAFGYPVVPILFILAADGFLINTIYASTFKSLIGIFLILAGLPVYYYLINRKMWKNLKNKISKIKYMANDRRSGGERRNDDRHNIKIDVEWEGLIGRKEGTISDISVNGCFVLCSGEVEDGENIKIFVPLNGGRKIQFWGEVVNHFPEIGFAVRFIELTEAQKDFLTKFVDT